MIPDKFNSTGITFQRLFTSISSADGVAIAVDTIETIRLLAYPEPVQIDGPILDPFIA